MRYEEGDFFGFRWRGSGIAVYNVMSSGSYICLDKVDPWTAGETITLATSDTRARRWYSVENLSIVE